MIKEEQWIRLAPLFCFILFAIVTILGCEKRDLRGRALPSADEGTYLVVEEVNGTGLIFVDEKPWPYPIHVAGPIDPGRHVIECNGKIEFEIQPGTTFRFDNWGPKE